MTKNECKSCIGAIELLRRLAYENCDKIISMLEQEPKTGHWIDKKPQIPGSPLSKMYWCDQCDKRAYKSEYCPNCGAKMESEG